MAVVKQRGFVLVIVLWSLALLSVLATQMVLAGRSATQTAYGLSEHAAAMAAADGGIQQAIFQLIRTNNNPTMLRSDSVIGRSRVQITIENQAGKINPNLASIPLLRALLVALGEPPRTAETIADAIVDWRTPAPMSAGGGLKRDVYLAAHLSYGPAGRMFHSIKELGLIPGITPVMLARLRPWLCLYLDNAVESSAAIGPVAEAVARAESEEITFPATDRVFLVSAVATNRGRARFVRRAIIRFRPGNDGTPQTLTWDSE